MRSLIYLFPILINYVLGGVFFITAYRFAEAGANELVVTATIAVWSAVYSVASLAVGRFTTEHNAPRLIVAAGIGIAFASLGFIVVPAPYWQFLWIALVGVASAVYCVPFQVFMKAIEPDRSAGTVRSTALYTFSWSIGVATGPFIFGLFAWRTGFVINIVLGLVIAAGVLAVDRHRRCHPAVPAAHAPAAADAVDYTQYPDFAWIGWLVAGAGIVTVTLVRTLVPYRGALLELPRAELGLVLAAVSYVQGVMALSLIRSKVWMYKPLPALLAGASGAIGLVLFGLGSDVWAFYLGALFYGLYSGTFFFYLVFHALVHPTRNSRYVSINEVVVGITGVIGPLAGGFIAKSTAAGIPFLFCGLLAFGVGLFQALVFQRKRRRPAPGRHIG
jgi:MFS family permease